MNHTNWKHHPSQPPAPDDWSPPAAWVSVGARGCKHSCPGNATEFCGGRKCVSVLPIKCPPPPPPTNMKGKHQWNTQRLILVVSSTLSLFGSLMIILSFYLFPEIRFPSRKIIMMISICDFMTSLAFLISGFDQGGGLDDGAADGKPWQPTAMCYVQGYLLTFSYLASFLWTACFAYHLLGLFSTTEGDRYGAGPGKKKSGALAERYHILCWGLPAAELVLLYFLQRSGRPSIGRSDRFWCWISTYDRTGQQWKAEGAWLQFSLFYIPLLFIIVFNAFTYLRLHSTIRSRRSISPEMERAIARRLQLYLLVFLLCSVWGFANRIVSVTTHIHTTSLTLDYLEVSCRRRRCHHHCRRRRRCRSCCLLLLAPGR